MKRFIYLALGMAVLIIVLCSGFNVFGSLSAADILNKVDYNMAPGSVIYDAKLIIHQSDRTDTKAMKLYGEGQEKSYAVFLSPERDKGTAILRLGDNLWMYLPSAEKTIKIAGHMLRQSFMGSDFSFGDSTERLKLLEKYDAIVSGTENFGERQVYVLELQAKQADAAYFKRKMWVDQERFTVLKQEMYAKSGKLLKDWTMDEYKLIGDRYYATKIRMEDKLKKGTYTEMIFTNISLDAAIPAEIFTQKNLEKKK